jgi:hypothetical protein
MFALQLLAQMPPPSGEQLILAYWILGLFLFLNAANSGSAIFDRFRQKPPAHDIFQTKLEADRLEVRMRTEISALNTRSESRSKENYDLVQNKINELERILAEKIGDNKNNTNERFGRIDGQMAAFMSSLSGLSNDLMHQVGRIEGRLDPKAARRA